MSWLRRLFKRQSLENPRTKLSDAWTAPKVMAGVAVTEASALGLSAFYSGVNQISRHVGMMDCYVYRRVDDGKERARNHQAFRLLARRPNREQTPFVFKQFLQMQALMRGNGYAYINRDTNGRPLELIPLDASRTRAKREAGAVSYVTQVGERQFELQPDDVLHIRAMGDDLEGYSILELARQTLGLGIAARDHGAATFGNGARPSLALMHPENS